MHHPGPPRFVTVGEEIQLAPRSPDPDGPFAWELQDAPAESDASIVPGAVVDFVPDEPGRYRFALDAPDGVHELTVRVFPDPRRPARFELPLGELPNDPRDTDRVSVIAPFNEHVVGEDHPRIEDDAYVFETRLPPGEHPCTYIVDYDRDGAVRTTTTVPGPGRPRVRLDAEQQDGEVVVTATPHAGTDSEYADDELDVEFHLDDRDDLDRDDLDVSGHRATVPVAAIEDTTRIHAVAVGERHSVADTVRLDLADGSASAAETPGTADTSAVAVDRINDPPAWTTEASVYEIYVRSFAGGKVDTTFGELERRVPYIDWLGIDCVWLTPVLSTPTEHGYEITDYYETASDLGTREDLESFVETCHDHDIKVIFDLVVNHSSRDHPAFHMSAAGVPEYRDWYVWEDDEAQFYFNWDNIPNFNYRSLAVREHLLDVIDEWAEVMDGFRCDVAWGVPHSFWKEVRERVKADHPDFLLLDETLPRDPDYHEGEFDMHYDSHLYGTLREIGEGETAADAILDAAEAPEREGFPASSVHMRYIENHDVERYLSEYGRDAQKAAAAATFTLPGAPLIYAGQERGSMEYRGPVPWSDGDRDLTEYHQRLMTTREDSPALRRGSLDRIGYETAANATAFARESDDERVVVVLNFDDEPATVTVDERVDPVDLVSGDRLDADETADGHRLTVDCVAVLRAD